MLVILQTTVYFTHKKKKKKKKKKYKPGNLNTAGSMPNRSENNIFLPF